MSRVNYPDVIKRIPFNDPEVFADYEERAIDGALDYDKFPPEEYKYFSRLSKVGYMNRHHGWSKEICEEKQRELLKDYRSERDDREFFGRIARDMQANIKKADTLKCDITKTSDPAEKLHLALECIGLMTGDEVFARMNEKE